MHPLLRLPLEFAATQAWGVKTLAEAGILAPQRPDRLARVGLNILRWGVTPAAGYASGAARNPDATALVDDLGTLTFAELEARTTRLANALREDGIAEGSRVGLLCRNHRGWIESTVALSKLGAHALYLNTGFAAPQISDVMEREGAQALVYDEEFSGLVADAAEDRRQYVAWHEGAGAGDGDALLEDLIARGSDASLSPPTQNGRQVILTSGTTGTPKGANRAEPKGLEPIAAILSKIPLRANETTHIAAPLFHAWGFAHWSLALLLGSRVVLRRKFDPESALAATAEQRASALVVVPVMLQRILELGDEIIDRYDLSALRTIPVSGSALPGDLAVKVMDRFGDKLYNLYGSTEVAWASIATPEDLRAAPGTAGRPPRGTVVKIYDEAGRQELPAGETGRIFVGNGMLFEGYTGGGTKDEIDGLMATGDVGHFDEGGRLFVDGRDDDMIVSGGENVFPKEVEDCIAGFEGVKEVAVVGVEDREWGQRLKAYVVAGDTALTEQDVKDRVKAELAGYKVPRDVDFIQELPRNATGKVLKRDLAG
jgi:acyl-CoA synthetase (AMP-forming)/AMP-acid ligase II